MNRANLSIYLFSLFFHKGIAHFLFDLLPTTLCSMMLFANILKFFIFQLLLAYRNASDFVYNFFLIEQSLSSLSLILIISLYAHWILFFLSNPYVFVLPYYPG